MIIPTWQHQLTAQTQEWVRNYGPVRVWLRVDHKWPWVLLGTPLLLVWICGSGYLIRHAWKTHPLDSSRKKLFWTVVLVVPLLGWMLYGQFYSEPKNQVFWMKR